MRWIFIWEDGSGDADRDCKRTVDSIEEYRQAVDDFLEDETAMTTAIAGVESVEVPALQFLADEVMDLNSDEEVMSWDGREIECIDGTLTITRER